MLWKHYERVATGFARFPEKNQQAEKPKTHTQRLTAKVRTDQERYFLRFVFVLCPSGDWGIISSAERLEYTA